MTIREYLTQYPNIIPSDTTNGFDSSLFDSVMIYNYGGYVLRSDYSLRDISAAAVAVYNTYKPILGDIFDGAISVLDNNKITESVTSDRTTNADTTSDTETNTDQSTTTTGKVTGTNTTADTTTNTGTVTTVRDHGVYPYDDSTNLTPQSQDTDVQTNNTTNTRNVTDNAETDNTSTDTGNAKTTSTVIDNTKTTDRYTETRTHNAISYGDVVYNLDNANSAYIWLAQRVTEIIVSIIPDTCIY